MGTEAILALKTCGPLLLFAVLAAGALGIPLPGSMLLLASGASVGAGLLDAPTVLAAALTAVVFGDCSGYLLGRLGVPLFGGLKKSPAWRGAEKALDRWDLFAIPLTRCLLTPLGAPTNLIAGGTRYPFGRFVALDVFGEAVWVVLYAGLGYLFAAHWEVVGDIAGRLAGGRRGSSRAGRYGLTQAAFLPSPYRLARGFRVSFPQRRR